MELYSTNNPGSSYDLKEAVLSGLAPDGGLFMPHSIPPLPSSFWHGFHDKSFAEICTEVSQHLLSPFIPAAHVKQIISQSFDFSSTLVQLSDSISILELFHGPSLAFKDFGAQFMAQLMSYFHTTTSDPLVILVATSGDTGGAVAAGFHRVPGIEVVILYPKGKVSPLQQKQLTTFGDNVAAIEVDGTFDDCQALVKNCFIDTALQSKINLSSANSINIARLIPQSFYYFEAVKQLGNQSSPVVVSVPSGNFGNLTAGLIAKLLGLPIRHFIAATNINDVVPTYLNSGVYTPRPSIATLSNAMDVGNPSNFVRMLHLYGSTWNHLRRDITGYAFSDEETIKAIQDIYQQYDYISDPHGAVAYLGLKAYLGDHPDQQGIFLATAHYSKFKETIDHALGYSTPLHSILEKLQQKPGNFMQMPNSYQDIKDFLLAKYAV